MTANTGKVFRRYFVNNILSSLMFAAYVLCDTIFIGWSVGSEGLAALNICLPIYNLILGTALMTGIGGATAMNFSIGQGDVKRGQAFFTLSFSFALVVALVLGIAGFFFWEPLAAAMGAKEAILPYVGEYMRLFSLCAALFVLNNMLPVFVRSDNAPRLAMIAGVSSGLLNIVLDYVFMFPMKMGMFGAILATVISTGMSVLILCSRLFSRESHLRFVRKFFSLPDLWRVLSNGFPSLMIESCTGLVTILFNWRIIATLGVPGLTAYSVVTNSAIVVIALFNGTAQTIQPLVSINRGAGNFKRVQSFFHLSLCAAIMIGCIAAAVGWMFPEVILGLFLQAPDQTVLDIALPAIGIYFTAFLFMGLNVVYATYLQSMERAVLPLVISVSRGILFVVLALFALSYFFGPAGIWAAVPAAELVTLLIWRAGWRARPFF